MQPKPAKKKQQPFLTPTAAEVPALTARAVKLRTVVNDARAELAVVEAMLEAYALEQPHEHLADAAREGRRVALAEDLAVVFTADELIGSFKDQSPKHAELLKLAADRAHLAEFFRPPCDWKRAIADGQKFRDAINAQFAPSTAAAFLAACRAVDANGVPKSRTVFEYAA